MTWVSIPLVTLCFSAVSVASDCRGAECNKFKCSSEPFPPRPVDPYLRPGSSFTSPCSCEPDWNSIFCNLTQYLLSTPHTTSVEYPTVCVCRKFSDNNSKCDQFISRCFKKSNKQCTCCFNQPYQYCHHLNCKNNEPDFSGSNTSCVCHHTPSDYPYQICKAMYARDGTRLLPALPAEMEQAKTITLLNVTVPITAFLYVIVGILVVVALLTIIILVAGNRKLNRRREDTSRQRQAAQEALLLQRADDDRYLPTV